MLKIHVLSILEDSMLASQIVASQENEESWATQKPDVFRYIL